MRDRLILVLRVVASIRDEIPVDQADIDLMRSWVCMNEHDPEELALSILQTEMRRFRRIRIN